MKASVKKAKYKAIRDSDMCVKSAQLLINKFFVKHPEWALQYIVAQSVVKEEMSKQIMIFKTSPLNLDGEDNVH